MTGFLFSEEEFDSLSTAGGFFTPPQGYHNVTVKKCSYDPESKQRNVLFVFDELAGTPAWSNIQDFSVEAVNDPNGVPARIRRENYAKLIKATGAWDKVKTATGGEAIRPLEENLPGKKVRIRVEHSWKLPSGETLSLKDSRKAENLANNNRVYAEALDIDGVTPRPDVRVYANLKGIYESEHAALPVPAPTHGWSTPASDEPF